MIKEDMLTVDNSQEVMYKALGAEASAKDVLAEILLKRYEDGKESMRTSQLLCDIWNSGMTFESKVYCTYLLGDLEHNPRAMMSTLLVAQVNRKA